MIALKWNMHSSISAQPTQKKPRTFLRVYLCHCSVKPVLYIFICCASYARRTRFATVGPLQTVGALCALFTFLRAFHAFFRFSMFRTQHYVWASWVHPLLHTQWPRRAFYFFLFYTRWRSGYEWRVGGGAGRVCNGHFNSSRLFE